jgi:hypothetical protein
MSKSEILGLMQPTDYDIDPQGNLAYWDAVTGKLQVLEPAQPIEDQNAVVGKIGQQNLLPDHFSLKPKDLENTQITDESGVLVGKPVPPGISAFLFFGSKASKQDRLSSLSESYLGREVTKKNRLYITQVRDVLRAGWTAFFAPLIDRNYSIHNPLHVILVPNSLVVAAGSGMMNEGERVALTQSFIRWESLA